MFENPEVDGKVSLKTFEDKKRVLNTDFLR
jgi:hypothetical protein